MNALDAVILGLVEGLTEFLPVSSTGHMILTAWLLRLKDTAFLSSFEIAIQLGAIMAVVILYRQRFVQGWAMYQRLWVAFIPTATIGFVLYKLIKKFLFDPVVVSITLILGGIILIALNRWIEEAPAQYQDLSEMPLKKAAWIGLIQCVAMVPGVSRAGATILGGIAHGCDKKQATEFSFLLAVPTMLAATAYDLLKNAEGFSSDQFGLLAIGGIVAFFSAWLAIKAFIELVVRFGFAAFGWYRIALGSAVLMAIYVFGAHLQL